MIADRSSTLCHAIQEGMAAKMESITSMRVAAWQCRECGYLAEYPAKGCRPAGHALTRVPAAVKRWWTCRHCSNHFATVGVRYPATRCSKCAPRVVCLLSTSATLPPPECAAVLAHHGSPKCSTRASMRRFTAACYAVQPENRYYMMHVSLHVFAGASTRRLYLRRRQCCASSKDRKCRSLQSVHGCKPAAQSTESSWALSRPSYRVIPQVVEPSLQEVCSDAMIWRGTRACETKKHVHSRRAGAETSSNDAVWSMPTGSRCGQNCSVLRKCHCSRIKDFVQAPECARGVSIIPRSFWAGDRSARTAQRS